MQTFTSETEVGGFLYALQLALKLYFPVSVPPDKFFLKDN